MANILTPFLKYIAKNFRKDASKMLIKTGVAGWSLSSLAQIGAILVNPEISNDKKSYLIPQELADAFVNIGSFFLVTQATKRTVAKLFSTGKFAPSNVRKYLENSPFKDKVGKLDFKLDTILKQDKTFPAESYYTCKNFGTTVATITAGIVSSNIITPTIRNALATKMQKNYINNKQENPYKNPYKNSYTQKSNNSLRI